MIKLLNSWCTRCSEAGAHLDHFLLHINTLSLEAVRGGAVPRGRRTHRDASPRILHLQKRGREAAAAAPARLAGCESSLSARGVSLRLEINQTSNDIHSKKKGIWKSPVFMSNPYFKNSRTDV